MIEEPTNTLEEHPLVLVIIRPTFVYATAKLLPCSIYFNDVAIFAIDLRKVEEKMRLARDSTKGQTVSSYSPGYAS